MHKYIGGNDVDNVDISYWWFVIGVVVVSSGLPSPKSHINVLHGSPSWSCDFYASNLTGSFGFASCGVDFTYIYALNLRKVIHFCFVLA